MNEERAKITEVPAAAGLPSIRGGEARLARMKKLRGTSPLEA
jgi:hypothetical protein